MMTLRVFFALVAIPLFFTAVKPCASAEELDFGPGLLGTSKDRLVDVHCPKCEDFESRRLEVLKAPDGTMTALRFSKIHNGIVTDTIGPNQLKSGLVPMYEQSGFTVIQLDARLVNPEKGGPATMIWFGNVLTHGGRGSLKMAVEQAANGTWELNINGQKVQEFIITPSRFGVDEVDYR